MSERRRTFCKTTILGKKKKTLNITIVPRVKITYKKYIRYVKTMVLLNIPLSADTN